jgi:uncharacterized protein
VTIDILRLVLFARFPVAGECKTRLIPAVGAAGAADIHRHLTQRTVSVLRQSGQQIILAYTGAERDDFAQWLGDDIAYVRQAEGDLTDKLLACLNPAPVLFFGADTPDLSAEIVGEAINALLTHDVVLGPAEDGGYYLIGMRRALPQLLTDMPWSTDQVMPETLRRLSHMGIEPVILATLSDCDRPEDLARWPHLTP